MRLLIINKWNQYLFYMNKMLHKHKCAQCYPRLACPLHVPLFMQLRDPARSTPGLALLGKKSHRTIMQTHALKTCTPTISGINLNSVR
jgi:hypothetical protein